MSTLSIRLKVHGKVQGVFYRKSTAEKATSLGLVGWVKNNPDGTVEVMAQGDEKDVAKLVKWCWEGPKNAVVTKVEQQQTGSENYLDFRVIR